MGSQFRLVAARLLHECHDTADDTLHVDIVVLDGRVARIGRLEAPPAVPYTLNREHIAAPVAVARRPPAARC